MRRIPTRSEPLLSPERGERWIARPSRKLARRHVRVGMANGRATLARPAEQVAAASTCSARPSPIPTSTKTTRRSPRSSRSSRPARPAQATPPRRGAHSRRHAPSRQAPRFPVGRLPSAETIASTTVARVPARRRARCCDPVGAAPASPRPCHRSALTPLPPPARVVVEGEDFAGADARYATPAGIRIPRPWSCPASRSAIASLIASSGYVVVCRLTWPWAVSVISSWRSV